MRRNVLQPSIGLYDHTKIQPAAFWCTFYFPFINSTFQHLCGWWLSTPGNKYFQQFSEQEMCSGDFHDSNSILERKQDMLRGCSALFWQEFLINSFFVIRISGSHQFQTDSILELSKEPVFPHRHIHNYFDAICFSCKLKNMSSSFRY